MGEVGGGVLKLEWRDFEALREVMGKWTLWLTGNLEGQRKITEYFAPAGGKKIALTQTAL